MMDNTELFKLISARKPVTLFGVGYVPEAPQSHANTKDALIAEALQLISGDRQKTYGTARDNFTSTGKLWEQIIGAPITPVQVALCMVQLKIDRLCHTPGHRDSWVDAIGYLALGGEIALDGDQQVGGEGNA